MSRLTAATGGILLIIGIAWYLRDPPWAGAVTSGMRQWEEDATGTRFRWTAGHGSFFIPSVGSELTLPLRAVLGGTNGPVVVNVSVDDRWLADVELSDPAEWRVSRFPLPARPRRQYRRVDVRVNRVVPPYNLGVEVGEPIVR